jgi:hypothetical protein
MLHYQNFISGGSEYLFRIDGQEVLGTRVTEESVQSRKPECQASAVFGFPNDVEDFGVLFAWTIIVVRIERIQRDKVIPLVLDQKVSRDSHDTEYSFPRNRAVPVMHNRWYQRRAVVRERALPSLSPAAISTTSKPKLALDRRPKSASISWSISF